MEEKSEWIVELTEELTKETKVSGDEQGRWKKRSIYKIPVHAVNLNKNAYFPWVAAIGPYHHKDNQLQRMEEHKKRALRHFLSRSDKPLEAYIDALAKVVPNLMDAYAHLDEYWKQDKKGFLRLMIVDGSFILETMLADDRTTAEYSSHDDLIFSDHGKHNVIPCIRRDMLLLENQLPLLVLETLIAVHLNVSNEEIENQVIERILKFYGLHKSAKVGKCRHILDVYRKSMTRDIHKKNPKSTKTLNSELGVLRSATELKEAGIKFKNGSHKSLKDIKFKGRTLRLPTIHLDDTSESTFLNMVAFERLHIEAGNEISSYICFMNGLVRDERDVRLLKFEGVISSVMGSDRDVAALFVRLSNEILFESDTWLDVVYTDIKKRVDNHFKKDFFKWRYHLIHTYFKSPWAIISVIAGTLGLGLSAVQVVYAVLGSGQAKP